jgi:plasmid stability protein
LLDALRRYLQNGRSEGQMATLTVKHLPDALYRKLKARAKRERRSVAQEVVVLLQQALESPALLSILELRGLGKELGRDSDAGSYVTDERAGWRDRRSRPATGWRRYRNTEGQPKPRI